VSLWFETSEFKAGQQRVRERMVEAGLDAMLLFKQESMYYLTGFDTDGFVLFQTLASVFSNAETHCQNSKSVHRYSILRVNCQLTSKLPRRAKE
jgi:Xaa-Pro aminopeptidase